MELLHRELASQINALCLLASSGLHNAAGAQAAGAHVDGGNGAVGKLMADALQVGVEAALGLDVGMADKIANLRGLTTESTLFAHWIFLPVYRKN